MSKEQTITVLRIVGETLSKHLDNEKTKLIVEDMTNELREEGIIPLKD